MTSRACVFINSNDPNVRNKLINPVFCIKPKFPPNINLRELIAKQTFADSSRNSGRAPNAFIIYRKAFVEAARNDGYQLPMTIVSSMASRSWDLEPEFVKEEYKKLAKEANSIRNKLIPKLSKKRRQKWNIISFPPPSNTKPSTTSSPVNKKKSTSKKKKVETKEKPSLPLPSPSPSIDVPTFHIPYDICSRIEDRYVTQPFVDNSTSDNPPSTQEQPQREVNFNNFNNYIPQEEPFVDTFNIFNAVIIPDDINYIIDENDLAFFNEHGIPYASLGVNFN
ncbi:hypothetical protein RclHR1_03210005 [Rhizophagus clarus]|uniref:HMG box domain-containing protein n=1 Tax=Rhizophagus clarus TaxID=94130 RepID=A0A2Z6RJV1_9GLOM|nr:hypothetical protein RclHR1_03210005 [Rhizophagus clarus]GES82003.1 hypothetical protein GLOIN_2v1834786 [Rhizophagus clarus]